MTKWRGRQVMDPNKIGEKEGSESSSTVLVPPAAK
jgi:hypothetical protein